MVSAITGGGTKRAGFEILRDVVTHHRRQWTQTHLQPYLEQRWRIELLGVFHSPRMVNIHLVNFFVE